MVDATRASAITTPATISFNDTAWYGGTWWAPDSMRWEALRDSVWTFDTGVGSSINTGQNLNKPVGYHETMEGWFGIDQTLNTAGYFRRSTSCAINGSWSAWAGVTTAEGNALCYGSGQGYGNNWDTYFGKTFSYPGSGTVTFSYAYAVECEPGFDYAAVRIDTTGALEPSHAPELAYYTGTQSGIATIVLRPGFELPASGGTVTIWFNAVSDGSYSDQDGLNPTACGHSTFDDITLSGAITDFTDFESGPNAWAQSTPTIGDGDFSHLSDLDDLPIPVTCCNCAVQDSVLVFFTPSGGNSDFQDNIAVSPWIDLRRGGEVGSPGRIMAADLMTDLPLFNYVYVQIRARYYPYMCNGQSIVSPFLDNNVVYYFGQSPFCTSTSPYMRDYSSVIGMEAEQVQVAWGVVNFCWTNHSIPCTGVSNTTPYIDNVRFGVYGASTSSTPEPGESMQPTLAEALPNPTTGRTAIAFTNAVEGHVTIRVFDVRGRLVRKLVDQPMTAGRHEVIWDGTADEGQRVATGLYFYRMIAGDYSASRKLMIIE